METALFSPSCLFGDSDEDQESRDTEDRKMEAVVGQTREEVIGAEEEEEEVFVERSHRFPAGLDLIIREFSFHQFNANLLWPGSFAFSEWLFQNSALLHGRRILELGSGTGALAIFLQKSFGVDITTSDFDDKEIEENIAYNCRRNELDVLPHIRHSWGDPFPVPEPDWDLIIASDILLYVKQYPNLIKTLCFLLKSYVPRCRETSAGTLKVNSTMPTIAENQVQLQLPTFVMSWRRRIGKEDELLFFGGCADAGLAVQHVGARVYCITPIDK